VGLNIQATRIEPSTDPLRVKPVTVKTLNPANIVAHITPRSIRRTSSAASRPPLLPPRVRTESDPSAVSHWEIPAEAHIVARSRDRTPSQGRLVRKTSSGRSLGDRSPLRAAGRQSVRMSVT
jgi:hypothetical protein